MMARTNRRRRPKGRPEGFRRVLRATARALAGMMVLSALAAGGWWLNGLLTVRTWTIRGASGPVEAAMDDALARMEPLDLWRAWPGRLRRRLLADLPDLADLDVTRRLPDQLEIRAVMRKPVALWRGPRGVMLVDAHGAPYRRMRRGEALDLPLLRAPSDRLPEALALMRAVRRADSRRWRRLSEVIAEAGGWRLNFARGEAWLLPGGDEGARRVRRMAELLHRKRWRKGLWRVDARLPDRWFIRKSRIGGVV